MVSTAESESLINASYILGWFYFAVWSYSFYPQLYKCFKTKSVVGLSFEYCHTNLLGHTCYNIYNTLLFFSPLVQNQYKNYEHTSVVGVQTNDLVFSMHAMALTFGQILVIVLYGKPGQKLELWAKVFVICGWSSVFIIGFLCAVSAIPWPPFLILLTSIKLIVTIVKYFPQVILIYKQKGTEGWSTWAIVFDLLGGFGSLLQQLLLGLSEGIWYEQFSNIPKLGLALISVVYDSILIGQFVYYDKYLKGEYYIPLPVEKVYSDDDLDSNSDLNSDQEDLSEDQLEDQPLLS